MATQQVHLGVWDYVILGIVLLISAGIGVYYRFTGGKQKTVKEYLLADKNMHVVPVAFSLMASFMSAVTLLGVSSENYTYGFQFIIINISYALFTPVAAFVYLPVFFKLQATSAYEYLEKRFGKVARFVASICYTLQMILYMGIVLYAPALAFGALTGISKYAAILSVGLVCTFYSTIGGMKAVLMTDVFQSFLMFASVFSIIIYQGIDLGSLGEIWNIAEKGGRADLLNFNPDPTDRHTWFTLIIGGGITFLTLYGVNQTQVQRYMTMKDLKTAQVALFLQWPILTAMSISTSFAGLSIYSRYYDCDPIASNKIEVNDQLMPYYVVDTMGKIDGLTGLFMAGLASAALSTVSATINSLSAVTMEDYFKPLYKKIYSMDVAESKVSLYSKLTAFAYGFICLGVAFLAENLGGVLQASLTIFGVVGGPLLGLFSLGMFTTRANQAGSVTGLLAGLGIALWAAFGQPRPSAQKLPISTEGCVTNFLNSTSQFFNLSSYKVDGDGRNSDENDDYFWLYRLSYLYNVIIGLLTVYIGGYIFSWIVCLVTKREEKDYDPNLFITPLRRRLKRQQMINKNELEINAMATIS